MASFLVLTRVLFSKRFGPCKGCGLLLAIALQLYPASNCVAGPPLVTDDPGILEPGMWEVIIAVAGEDGSVEKILQAPVIDVSLGLSRNTQLSFVLPYTVVKSEEIDRQKGLDHASVGYKWRIGSSPAWEWAIAANYTLPVTNETRPADGSGDARVLSLPLLASHTRGDWILSSQIGWNLSSEGNRFWDFGLAFGHPLGDSVQLLMEVYGNASSSFNDNSLNYQLGFDYEITPALHFLASAGSRIKSESIPGNRLNYSYYLGLQWFH